MNAREQYTAAYRNARIHCAPLSHQKPCYGWGVKTGRVTELRFVVKGVRSIQFKTDKFTGWVNPVNRIKFTLLFNKFTSIAFIDLFFGMANAQSDGITTEPLKAVETVVPVKSESTPASDLQTLKAKLQSRVDEITSTRDPNEIMLAVVSTLELVISDIEEIESTEVNAQPDYSSMTMNELLDALHPDESPECNFDIFDAMYDLVRYEIASVTDDELKRASDELADSGLALVKMIDRELERRDDATRCAECGQLLEVCEASRKWIPATLYQPGEYVCSIARDIEY